MFPRRFLVLIVLALVAGLAIAPARSVAPLILAEDCDDECEAKVKVEAASVRPDARPRFRGDKPPRPPAFRPTCDRGGSAAVVNVVRAVRVPVLLPLLC